MALKRSDYKDPGALKETMGGFQPLRTPKKQEQARKDHERLTEREVEEILAEPEEEEQQ